jgi:hypothetical protein
MTGDRRWQARAVCATNQITLESCNQHIAVTKDVPSECEADVVLDDARGPAVQLLRGVLHDVNSLPIYAERGIVSLAETDSRGVVNPEQ